MNCPYCNKLISAFTGLQEVQKFRSHLVNCKKYPNRKVVLNNEPFAKKKTINLTCVSLNEALEIRAASGQ